ncbi:MAG TPA: zf-HC2 domain-containing protein, partial [Pyrinomonadaceae bacterium]|nr:zf-HC2 domain-containing protein [Pyrinomonadaceae bacterium]
TEGAEPRGCGRSEELVAYLYGESTPVKAELFRRHLDACAACREELAAFGGVREGLGEWRAQVLGSIPALDIHEAFTNPAPPRVERARSAASALREFFALSPLWLRAGAAAAVVAVCALSALTAARTEVRWDASGLAFRTGVPERVVTERVTETVVEPARGYTDEQVAAIVAGRLKEAKDEWQARRTQEQQTAQTQSEVVNYTAERQPKRKVEQRAASKQNAARPARTGPRGPERDEETADLPRLSDLLNDGSY